MGHDGLGQTEGRRAGARARRADGRRCARAARASASCTAGRTAARTAARRCCAARASPSSGSTAASTPCTPTPGAPRSGRSSRASPCPLGLAGEEARYGPEERYGPPSRFPAFAVVWFAVLATAYGPSVGFGEHSAFLLGLGNLGTDQLDTLAVATEPSNALSIPTWTVHFASAFGWLYATGMVNRYGEYTGNPKWRLLAFAMLPLHASGVAGCTYHFFFNSPDVSFLVALQAGLALIGHTALLIAGALLSLSNGWNVRMAIESATLSSANRAYRKRQLFQQQQGGRVPYDMRPTWLTVGGLGALSLLASYITKYAALTTRVPFDPSEGVLTGWLVCLHPRARWLPLLVAVACFL